MQDKITQIKNEYLTKIQEARNLGELDIIFLELFGKNGAITELPKQFSSLTPDEKKKIGPLFNQTKVNLEQEISKKRQQIREESYKKLSSETFNIKGAEMKKRKGHLHPITKFEHEIAELFAKLGFQQFDGPHIDSDLNNFQLLNVPEDHPARDLQDTFYLDTSNLHAPKGEKMVLRTHTSNSQIHIMKNYKLPIRMMAIGRCFRHENLDARHEHTFDQFELVYVDKKVNMANLQYLSEYFLKAMLGEDIKARLSPGYYPFTEPSAHIFGTCNFCKGEGCHICGQTGELELAGAGMVHPVVLKNCGIDPNEYSGIAWGAGPPRMAMLKYGINDVRAFNSGDLNILTNLEENNESK
jgi:phenylalanyl-tRNA synthetase alpha chain